MEGEFGIEYGAGALTAFPAWLRPSAPQRILLVTGRSSFETCGAAAQLAPLAELGEVVRWSDFEPNTAADDLQRGIEQLRALDADVVIGVGGGSVMDMAKLICAYDDTTDGAELQERIRSGERIERRSRRLLLAPTTAGSGSESTHFAVVYIGEEKFSIAGEGMRADGVALDPTLSTTGSAHQRATSGMDAVCQSIESLWAAGATAKSRRYARHALRMLLGAIETNTATPSDRSARAMAIGSHLAGRAIDMSKTTAAHALSYGITKQFGVDHGNAAALTLGAFIDRHERAPEAELQANVAIGDHRDAMAFILGALRATGPSGGRDRIVGLLRNLGLTSTLDEIGAVDETTLVALARSVNAERLGNNPVRLDDDDLVELLRASCADPSEIHG